MTKRYHDESEEQIKRYIHQLPRIQDARSKAEVYQKVRKQWDDAPQKKRRPVWLVPSLSAAALLLLFLLVPALFMERVPFTASDQPKQPESANQQQAQESDKADEEAVQEESENNQEETFQAEREEGPVVSDEEEESVNKQAEISQEPAVEIGETTMAFERYTEAVRTDDLQKDEQTVTVPFYDADTAVVVPLTFIIKVEENMMEAFEEISEDYAAANIGLHRSALEDVDWLNHPDEEGPLEAMFERDMSAMSSSESDVVVKSLEESLRFMNENELVLESNGKRGVELGKYGLMENVEQRKTQQGYYVYTTSENESFLVSGNASGLSEEYEKEPTFAEVLENMKTAEESSSVDPAIPEGVTIENVSEEGGSVQVVFSEDTSLADTPRSRAMLEAILFAAEDFGFEHVSFLGADMENELAQDYPAGEPMEVPVAPNYIEG
ncbi:Sporulation and spore germination [Alteribacillus persepolensis]|uniref:Sporulation and spore germination n=1 Tax=Alteribacillus persepolensis TaxID=568899 RepID=A0A1G8FGW1_9BACI|nr:GerMN domain-containing protein [Alteribacillus persepolensis]SDH81378.1 Sporulation and spore germination [Alteribacillus persepolensis]